MYLLHSADAEGEDDVDADGDGEADADGEAYSWFTSWRAALGLPTPGAVEDLQKEVKSELFAIICKSRPDVTCAVTQQHI
jgi:hypothetical protein